MTRYFVSKVRCIQDLKTCIESSEWACKDRQNPPQPADILNTAFKSGPVILIFSVNNCHGWHGYAEMMSPPFMNSDTETDMASEVGTEWKYFKIKWKVIFISEFGERCLPSSETESLTDLTGLSVNKARNWQELPVENGDRLCHLIEEYYSNLCSKRDAKVQEILEKAPKPFYSNNSDLQSSNTIWTEVVEKVERELGKVILACPFGSQRYNLSLPDSDTDMFIVYQARTSQMLGFNPPKQTVKNSDHQAADYTIHEIFRYAELLSSGDARCVETLFLHPSTLIKDSAEYQLLTTKRKQLLHRKTLDKYLRDAQGTHGTKLLRKWCNEHAAETVLPPKMCKLVYVIVRLLQNARDIVKREDLRVYREEGCSDRGELMYIRQGNVQAKKAWDIIDRLEKEITEYTEQVPEKSSNVDRFLEEWLLKLRYSDFHKELKFET